MPSSESSNSPSQPTADRFYRPWAVWMLRVVIGAVFCVSGFVKGVDPWGSVIKIGEYLDAWGWDVPDGMVTAAAFALAGYEFVWGSLLLLGCYKRVSVWALSLMMAFMLPLTLYIAIASPVDDCGCFGDAIILSNNATFVKNVLITAGLLYLWLYNRRSGGLFLPYVQWIAGGLVTLYILVIELIGYNIQPLVDFRRFAPGTALVTANGDTDDDDPDIVMEYTYEKDGEQHKFPIDNLPDSTWTFVSAEVVEGEVNDSDGFVILDDGEDITTDVIDSGTEQFIVTIPDFRNVDLSSTYIINELNDYITSRGGSLIALVGGGDRGLEWWQDISMATYPIYRADPKMIKELARGNAAIVYLDHGRVEWKRTIGSISFTLITDEEARGNLLEILDPQSGYTLKLVSVVFGGVMLVVFILDRSGWLLTWHLKRRKKKDLQA